MASNRPFRFGHSETEIAIPADWRVLDVGSGDCPHPRADVLADRYLGATEHRCGRVLTVDDRPTLLADACSLPFATRAFDFVIASHIAEHVPNPLRLCDELRRVSRAGYIETPGPLTDYLLGERFHVWSVRARRGQLLFRPLLAPRNSLGRWISQVFYAFFYMGEQRERRTWHPRLFHRRLWGSPLRRAKGFVRFLWKSPLLRRWTYTRCTFRDDLTIAVRG